jgi:hypothetical protein
MAAPSMNSIADRFAERSVGSIFLYTHEAHPGENYPHLTSMEQKFTHARDLRDKLGVTRPILVDSLDGACHRAYGSMPNMSWIFTKAGTPIYKSDWTGANSVQNAIEYFLEVINRRRSGERVVGFNVERLDFRTRDQDGFMAGLERNGAKAAREFMDAFD